MSLFLVRPKAAVRCRSFCCRVSASNIGRMKRLTTLAANSELMFSCDLISRLCLTLFDKSKSLGETGGLTVIVLISIKLVFKDCILLPRFWNRDLSKVLPRLVAEEALPVVADRVLRFDADISVINGRTTRSRLFNHSSQRLCGQLLRRISTLGVTLVA
jgi:hypothetical protein